MQRYGHIHHTESYFLELDNSLTFEVITNYVSGLDKVDLMYGINDIRARTPRDYVDRRLT